MRRTRLRDGQRAVVTDRGSGEGTRTKDIYGRESEFCAKL